MKKLLRQPRSTLTGPVLLALLAVLAAPLHGSRAASAVMDPADDITYGGLPQSQTFAQGRQIQVLKNRGFTLGYSETRRNPLWTAYQARPVERRRPYRRPETFKVDPRTQARVSSADYARSGYQRGHLAPSWLIFQLHGREAQLQTFLMSNVTPQRPRLNQKLWQRLEEVEADRFARWFDGVWVLAGPVFEPPVRQLRGRVAIPDAFYRIFVDEDPSGQPQVLAFLVPQTVRGEEPLDQFVVTVDEIEARTGLDFMPALDPSLQTRLESVPGDPIYWRLSEICCLPPRY